MLLRGRGSIPNGSWGGGGGGARGGSWDSPDCVGGGVVSYGGRGILGKSLQIYLHSNGDLKEI